MLPPPIFLAPTSPVPSPFKAWSILLTLFSLLFSLSAQDSSRYLWLLSPTITTFPSAIPYSSRVLTLYSEDMLGIIKDCMC